MSSRRAALVALSQLPQSAAKVHRIAEESLEFAKRARASVRRERINSQGAIPMTVPPQEPIDMPEDWVEDEDTRKIQIPTGT